MFTGEMITTISKTCFNDLLYLSVTETIFLCTYRLETELKKNENILIPDDLKSEFIEFCHQFVNSYVASDTWFSSSNDTWTDFKVCEGNATIAWKNEVGFRALFDILMVPTGIFYFTELLQNVGYKHLKTLKFLFL